MKNKKLREPDPIATGCSSVRSESRTWNAVAAGSNPATPTKIHDIQR